MISSILSFAAPYIIPILIDYLIKNTTPLIKKALEIEKDHKGQNNAFKKKLLFDSVWENNPKFVKFAKDCSWSEKELKIFLDVIVLISKKHQVQDWNKDDNELIRNFAGILIKKWVVLLSKKRK